MTLHERLDRYQRRHRWVGLPLAVLYKFYDDQALYLAALLTYYGFLSLFPLLLILVTVLSTFLSNDPALRQRVLDSALSSSPSSATRSPATSIPSTAAVPHSPWASQAASTALWAWPRQRSTPSTRSGQCPGTPGRTPSAHGSRGCCPC
ncbi:YhjD/YihY/BrkB family envelope integrity protein [Streptomyces sp. INA 01156]